VGELASFGWFWVEESDCSQFSNKQRCVEEIHSFGYLAKSLVIFYSIIEANLPSEGIQAI